MDRSAIALCCLWTRHRAYKIKCQSFVWTQ